MKKNKTLLLVGGGTGGHIVPILNLCYEFWRRRSNLKIVTVGGDSAIDKKLYFGRNNHYTLKTGKLHRNITLDNLIQLLLLFWGIAYAWFLLIKIKPDLIFSKAGYVSLPIILWAKILKIPYFIHESDIVMGASNKFASGGAQKIFVGFPTEYYSKMYRNKLKYVGQILPLDVIDLKNHLFNFEFKNSRPVIFVTGGSQGAKNINKAIFEILPELLSDYNVIHHTGSIDYDKAIKIRSSLDQKLRNNYFISPFLTKAAKNIDMMKSAINQSDLVIARASATTLAEISALKKAMVIIPYRYAAGDHQSRNAAYYKRHRAAVVISDQKLNGNDLKKQIDTLFLKRSLMKEMGKRAFYLQKLDCLSIITSEINKNLNTGEYEEI